jgi:hypothetical protein
VKYFKNLEIINVITTINVVLIINVITQSLSSSPSSSLYQSLFFSWILDVQSQIKYETIRVEQIKNSSKHEKINKNLDFAWDSQKIVQI